MFLSGFLKSRKSKVIIFICLFLLLTIGSTFIIKNYFVSRISESWENISNEKTIGIKNSALGLFENEQKKTSDFSSQLAANKKFESAAYTQNIKKTYEALYDLNDYKDYNVE